MGYSYYGTLIRNSYALEYCQWPSVTPSYPKPPHFRYFVSLLVSSEWLETETSNLVHRLIVASASPRVTNHAWRGMVRSHETFKFGWAPTISPEWLELEWSKFCMHVRYVKYQHKDDKPPLKGAWSGSRDHFKFWLPQWYLWNGWS